jgi:hypothetical protein
VPPPFERRKHHEHVGRAIVSGAADVRVADVGNIFKLGFEI